VLAETELPDQAWIASVDGAIEIIYCGVAPAADSD
jgi:hypothetical protein